MIVILRDAVTEHSSAAQTNDLEGKGIQTDKHHSLLYCTPKLLPKFILKSIFPSISHQVNYLSHQFKAVLQDITGFCGAAKCTHCLFNLFAPSQ